MLIEIYKIFLAYLHRRRCFSEIRWWSRIALYCIIALVSSYFIVLVFILPTYFPHTILTVSSSDDINRAPRFVKNALLPSILAYRDQWFRASRVLDRDGRPFPGKHQYIAPAIAWAEIATRNGFVGLSLVESDCEGPNSATSEGIFLCNATLSIHIAGVTKEKVITICYVAGDESFNNELSFNPITRTLHYRIVDQSNASTCSRSFPIG
jgi:hypothetical protein